jgi:hypothetical protein
LVDGYLQVHHLESKVIYGKAALQPGGKRHGPWEGFDELDTSPSVGQKAAPNSLERVNESLALGLIAKGVRVPALLVFQAAAGHTGVVVAHS